jgi:hypothetical protein
MDASNSGLNNPACTSGLTALPTGTNATACAGAVGRFVAVRLEAAGAQYLSLCEVQVWAAAPSPPPPFSTPSGLSLSNLALSGNAIQSGLYSAGTSPGKSNDGITACDPGGNEVGLSITALTVNPWWQLDLGGVFAVSAVTVFGRTAPTYLVQSSQLSIFVSSVSSDPTLGGGRNSTLCGSMVDAPATGITLSCGNAAGKYVTVVMTQASAQYLRRVDRLPRCPSLGGWRLALLAPLLVQQLPSAEASSLAPPQLVRGAGVGLRACPSAHGWLSDHKRRSLERRGVDDPSRGRIPGLAPS